MMRALIAAIVLTGSVALAHQRPAQRSVVVQVEDREVVLLVTWTAPTGVLGQLMLARANLLEPDDPEKGLAMLMAGRALGPLRVELDGAPLPSSKVDQKLTFDTSSQRRIAVTVLVTVPLPGAGKLRVSCKSREPTKLIWSNRMRQGQAHSRASAGRWQRGELRIDVQPPAR